MSQKHLLGDFGEIPQQDFEENLYSIDHDLRIISSYSFDDIKIWIITEADRSITTVLFPEKY
ncbi:MAG: type I restriction endonuclease subunit M [Candidatus Hodarchaeota archaeon]